MKSTAILMTAILLIGLFLPMVFISADKDSHDEERENGHEGKITGNVIAKAKTDQRAVSFDEVEHDDDLDDEFDVKDASEEIDDSVDRKARESTFAQVSIGQGWAISSGGNNTTSEGNFARIFWVEKTFVNVTTLVNNLNITNETNSFANSTGYTLSGYNNSWSAITLTSAFNVSAGVYNQPILLANLTVSSVGVLSNATSQEWGNISVSYTYTNTGTTSEATKAIGALKIGSDLYRLTLNSQTNDSIMFDVVSEKGKVNGTLELEADLSLAGFTVWSGTLDLDSGKSYDINVATKNSKVKGSAEVRKEIKNQDKQPGLKGNLNAETRGEGKKFGLFARIRAFFSGGE